MEKKQNHFESIKKKDDMFILVAKFFNSFLEKNFKNLNLKLKAADLICLKYFLKINLRLISTNKLKYIIKCNYDKLVTEFDQETKDLLLKFLSFLVFLINIHDKNINLIYNINKHESLHSLFLLGKKFFLDDFFDDEKYLFFLKFITSLSLITFDTQMIINSNNSNNVFIKNKEIPSNIQENLNILSVNLEKNNFYNNLEINKLVSGSNNLKKSFESYEENLCDKNSEFKKIKNLNNLSQNFTDNLTAIGESCQLINSFQLSRSNLNQSKNFGNNYNMSNFIRKGKTIKDFSLFCLVTLSISTLHKDEKFYLFKTKDKINSLISNILSFFDEIIFSNKINSMKLSMMFDVNLKSF